MKPNFSSFSVARMAAVATCASLSAFALALIPARADAAMTGSAAPLVVSFTIPSACSVQSRDLLGVPPTGPNVTCLHDEVANIAQQSALPSATAVDTTLANDAAPENENAAPGTNAAIGATTWVVTF